MENEIVSHRRRCRGPACGRAGRPGRERSGHLRARERVSTPTRARTSSELAGEPLGSDGDDRRALAPGRGARELAARRLATARAYPSPRAPRCGVAREHARRRGCCSSAARDAHARTRGSRSSCASASTAPRCAGSSSTAPDELARRRPRSRRRARPTRQLVLVCGHGTRDACCALRGTAVYGALAEHARRRGALALVAPGRPPLRGERPRPSRGHPARPARARERRSRRRATRSPGVSTSTHYRGRDVLPARVQAAERAVASRRAARRGRRSPPRRRGRRRSSGSASRTAASTPPSSRSDRARPCPRAAARSPSRRPAFTRASSDALTQGCRRYVWSVIQTTISLEALRRLARRR